MPDSIEQVREWIKYQKEQRHSQRIKEQKTDQEFFEDKFNTPLIKDAKYKIRTGFTSSMCNGITQQLITSKPRVFTEPKNDKREAGSKRIASLGNRQLKTLSQYPDNPIYATFKRNFLRGEAWLYTPHVAGIAKWNDNEDWREIYPNLIPVHFIIYDPIVVFSDPNEEIDGVPARIAVSFDRFVSDIKKNYPLWTGKPNVNYKEAEKINFMLYFTNEYSYAEADEQSLFRDDNGRLVNGEGKRDNLYNLVPFNHSYSGWGIENETKDPELMAYSRVRMIRDKIVMDATMSSDFEKNIHEYAWKHRVMVVPDGMDFDANTALSGYKPDDDDSISVVRSPNGTKPEVEETKLFDESVFAYRQMVKGELMGEYPAALRGAMGSSGRDIDVAAYHGLELYDCCLQNTENLWAKALDHVFRICDKLDIMPKGMNKGDSESYSELTVNLKKDSPSEIARRSADGDMKYKNGIISLKTNLIEFQGYTEEEAEQEEAEMLASNVMREHPFFKDLTARMVAQEAGVGTEFDQYMNEMSQSKSGNNPVTEFGKRGGEPRSKNIKTSTGMEMADQATGHERRLPAGMAQ